jgi:hypothetical protein
MFLMGFKLTTLHKELKFITTVPVADPELETRMDTIEDRHILLVITFLSLDTSMLI